MQPSFALRQISFSFQYLVLASALWLFSQPPLSVGAKAPKDSRQIAQRD